MEQLPTLQPWHTFTAIFVTFWAVSAYFDHFLMTTVFCIAFGVLTEIMVKTVYGGEPEKVETDLEKEKKKLEDLVNLAANQEQDLLVMETKEEMTDIIVIEPEETFEENEDADEVEDEDEAPPPLPDRDYEESVNPLEVEKELDGTQVVVNREEHEEKLMGRQFEEKESDGIQAGGEFIEHHDDFTDTQDEVEIIPIKLEENENDENDSKLDDTIVPIESNEGCETTTINPDLLIDFTEVTKTDLPSSEEENSKVEHEQITCKIVSEDIESNDVERAEPGQTAESPCQLESSELTVDTEKEAIHNETDSDREAVPSSGMDSSETGDLLDNLIKGDVDLSGNDGAKPTEQQEIVKVPDGVEDIDIDLADPAVEAAATKIQSAFKGYKTRQRLADN